MLNNTHERLRKDYWALSNASRVLEHIRLKDADQFGNRDDIGGAACYSVDSIMQSLLKADGGNDDDYRRGYFEIVGHNLFQTVDHELNRPFYMNSDGFRHGPGMPSITFIRGLDLKRDFKIMTAIDLVPLANITDYDALDFLSKTVTPMAMAYNFIAAYRAKFPDDMFWTRDGMGGLTLALLTAQIDEHEGWIEPLYELPVGLAGR